MTIRKMLIWLVVISGTFNLQGQSPEKISYQCVVRNSAGKLLTNKDVGIRITILENSPSGLVVYRETYNPDPQTNGDGILSLEIGSGLVITGNFSAIDWSHGPYFLKTETDPNGGTNYSIVGTSQLLTVPYALYSQTAATAEDAVRLTGDQSISGTKTFTGTINANSKVISGVANPVNNQDAANKAYVDVMQTEVTKLKDLLKPAGVVTDADGNVYNTVTIGGQVWMAENLKTTKYNDGTVIPLSADNISWITSGGYCWYDDDKASNKSVYGALYNWSTMTSNKLCPVGWHVPKRAEWTTLITYLGGESVAGGKMKETGFLHWQSPNTGATNESGFSALPGGICAANGGHYEKVYFDKGNYGWWWCKDYGINIFYQSGSISYFDPTYWDFPGVSVRCLRD
jgi:uncharacterized protein (TIGR02145 family)